MLPVEAVDPGDPEAEVRRSLRVPAVAGEEADALGTDTQPLDRKPVDAGVGLVDADILDRQHGVEAVLQSGRANCGLEHRRAAVGEDRRCQARRFQGVEGGRSEEHTSELQSLMRSSYA